MSSETSALKNSFTSLPPTTNAASTSADATETAGAPPAGWGLRWWVARIDTGAGFAIGRAVGLHQSDSHSFDTRGGTVDGEWTALANAPAANTTKTTKETRHPTIGECEWINYDNATRFIDKYRTGARIPWRNPASAGYTKLRRPYRRQRRRRCRHDGLHPHAIVARA